MQQVGQTVRLTVGQSKEARINANNPWNDTLVELEQGATYRIEPHQSDFWIDLVIPAGPEGYASPNGLMKAHEAERRLPEENWFALIGTIGDALVHAFVIGKGTTYRALEAGELVCFANDIEEFYGNNFGYIQINITRQS